jgi:hypothetical protein
VTSTAASVALDALATRVLLVAATVVILGCAIALVLALLGGARDDDDDDPTDGDGGGGQRQSPTALRALSAGERFGAPVDAASRPRPDAAAVRDVRRDHAGLDLVRRSAA